MNTNTLFENENKAWLITKPNTKNGEKEICFPLLFTIFQEILPSDDLSRIITSTRNNSNCS